MKYTFPKDFLWGGATSAPQSEGNASGNGKGENIWDYWYKISPEKFYNQVGPQVTSDFYHKYKEYIQLMKEVGFNSYRTSISWSRLIPDGNGEVNQEAVNFYNNVIDELIANDIEPVMNLFHFDMPMEMQKIGGWENREVVMAFSRYAKICFQLFGDRVKKFITHNEPIVVVECGYLGDFHYPCVVDMKRATQVAYNLMLSSALAIKELKELNISDAKIGIVLNVSPVYPRDINNEADVQAARLADLISNLSFIDPSVKGKYPEELITFVKTEGIMPKYEAEDLDVIANHTVDFLGVNYYQPRRVKAKENFVRKEMMLPEDFYDHYDYPEKKMNPYRGWEIYEKGIYDIAVLLKESYGNIPWFVSENGMGVADEERFMEDGMIQDDYRIDFIKGHLRWLHQAMEEGANCFGYHLWASFDCWSWLNAFKNRYGFIRVDIEQDNKLSIKKSGYWFKELTRNNGFE